MNSYDHCIRTLNAAARLTAPLSEGRRRQHSHIHTLTHSLTHIHSHTFTHTHTRTHATPQLVDRTILKGDVDKDGKLSYEEFVTMIKETDVGEKLNIDMC
jgi:hypothetical protein